MFRRITVCLMLFANLLFAPYAIAQDEASVAVADDP